VIDTEHITAHGAPVDVSLGYSALPNTMRLMNLNVFLFPSTKPLHYSGNLSLSEQLHQVIELARLLDGSVQAGSEAMNGGDAFLLRLTRYRTRFRFRL
jgi:hypothetical protein